MRFSIAQLFSLTAWLALLAATALQISASAPTERTPGPQYARGQSPRLGDITPADMVSLPKRCGDSGNGRTPHEHTHTSAPFKTERHKPSTKEVQHHHRKHHKVSGATKKPRRLPAVAHLSCPSGWTRATYGESISAAAAGMHVEKLQYVLHVLIDVHSNMPYVNFAHGLWPPTAWNFDMIKKCLPG